MSGKIIYILIALTVMISFSCEKIRQIPPEPNIDFRSFSMFDTTDNLGNTYKAGILEFYFEDGDGDIGLNQPLEGDLEDEEINLFFYEYMKESGIYGEPNDTIGYRIPYMERVGQNQIIQGTIEITFLYKFYTEEDTIYYDFFLLDRALNISNTSTSCEISFAGEGGCIPAVTD